ncbi:UNVERIFIED_CONTAM: hypothetical protein HDU68_002367 [Siphonaria sp. JEL0065]|nr:hypothetical protein HDU68_002367 [Siphonaria sp. JEL0065]
MAGGKDQRIPLMIPVFGPRIHELDESERTSPQSPNQCQPQAAKKKRRGFFTKLLSKQTTPRATRPQSMLDLSGASVAESLHQRDSTSSVPGAFPLEDRDLDGETEGDQEDDNIPDDSLPVSSHIFSQLASLTYNRELAVLLPYLYSAAKMLRLVEKFTHRFPLLLYVYKRYEVPPLTQAAVLATFVFSVFRRAMKQNARLVSNLLGFVYPALMSVLAIERPRDGDEERLFTYWTAFGAFTVLDHLSPQILALYPAYFTTKISILYWLYSKEGSFMVYRKHGLWGDETHMNFIVSSISEKHSNAEFLNCALNTGTNTYAGIDGCGHILVSQILARLKDESKPIPTHVSFVGYSFGGLVIRFAIGVLYAKGLLVHDSSADTRQTSSDSKPVLIAANFVTFASPHLGAPRTMPESSLNPVFNTLGAILAADTGVQMLLRDNTLKGRKAIDILADPSLPFWQGLALFKTRVLYANTTGDPLVPHYTASILPLPKAPLNKPQLTLLQPIDAEKYPSIVSYDPETIPPPESLPSESEPPKSIREKITTPLFYTLFITIALTALGVRRLFWQGIKTTRVVRRVALGTKPDETKWDNLAGYHTFKWVESWNATTTITTTTSTTTSTTTITAASITPSVSLFDGQFVEEAGLLTASNIKDSDDYAVKNLSKLKWDRVHVKSEFRRAHATIIRRSDEFKGNEDVVRHYVDHYL